MKKFLQKLKDNRLLLDAANVVLGLIMVVAFILTCTLHSNIALLFVVWGAGFMNIVNGLKAMGRGKQKAMGQSMVFLGFLIVIGGTMLVLSMMNVF